MDRIKRLIRNLENLADRTNSFTSEIMEGESEVLTDELRSQLLEGKGGDDMGLRPFYTEDLKSRGGFFRDTASALRYAKRKDERTYPKPIRPENINYPNLYITGAFYESLFVQYFPDGFMFDSNIWFANKIFNKYGIEKFALTDIRMERLSQERIVPKLREKIKDYINGKNRN